MLEYQYSHTLHGVNEDFIEWLERYKDLGIILVWTREQKEKMGVRVSRENVIIQEMKEVKKIWGELRGAKRILILNIGGLDLEGKKLFKKLKDDGVEVRASFYYESGEREEIFGEGKEVKKYLDEIGFKDLGQRESEGYWFKISERIFKGKSFVEDLKGKVYGIRGLDLKDEIKKVISKVKDELECMELKVESKYEARGSKVGLVVKDGEEQEYLIQSLKSHGIRASFKVQRKLRTERLVERLLQILEFGVVGESGKRKAKIRWLRSEYIGIEDNGGIGVEEGLEEGLWGEFLYQYEKRGEFEGEDLKEALRNLIAEKKGLKMDSSMDSSRKREEVRGLECCLDYWGEVCRRIGGLKERGSFEELLESYKGVIEDLGVMRKIEGLEDLELKKKSERVLEEFWGLLEELKDGELGLGGVGGKIWLGDFYEKIKLGCGVRKYWEEEYGDGRMEEVEVLRLEEMEGKQYEVLFVLDLGYLEGGGLVGWKFDLVSCLSGFERSIYLSDRGGMRSYLKEELKRVRVGLEELKEWDFNNFNRRRKESKGSRFEIEAERRGLHFSKYEGIMEDRKVISRIRGGLRVLTASHFERYGSCPMRYYFQDVIGVRARERGGVVRERLDAAEKGKLVHWILHKIYEKGEEAAGLVGELEVEEMMKSYAEKEVGKGGFKLLGGKTMEEIKRRVGRFLKKERFQGKDSEVKHTEFRFEGESGLRIEGGGGRWIELRGVIDRIDKMNEMNELKGGGFEVIDYKSGNMGESRNEVIRRMRLGLRFQPYIYIEKAKELFGGSGGIWKYYYVLDDRNEKKVKEVSIDFEEEEELRKLSEEYLKDYWGKMERGYFPLNPKDCVSYCEYQKVCRVDLRRVKRKEEKERFWVKGSVWGNDFEKRGNDFEKRGNDFENKEE